MDSSPLSIELQNLISRVPGGASQSSEEVDVRQLFSTCEEFDEFHNGVSKLIASDLRFANQSDYWMQEPDARLRYSSQVYGGQLVRRAIQTGDAGVAITWLQKVLQTTRTTGAWITAIWNIPVERRIELASNTSLMPLNQLPETPQKRELMNLGPWSNPLPNSLTEKPPQSALLTPIDIEPFLIPATNDEVPYVRSTEVRNLHEDILRALTVLGPRPAIRSMSWFVYDDPEIELARVGTSRVRHYIEVLPLAAQDYPPLMAAEAIEAVHQFIRLPAKTRSRLSVALDRLALAMTRHRLGDRAVEVSIALESLTSEPGETSEVTHKTATRTTRMIGGSHEQRQANFRSLKKTYGIRSRLVHSGEVNEDEVSRTEVERSIELCADLARRIMNMGAIPRWSDFDILNQ